MSRDHTYHTFDRSLLHPIPESPDSRSARSRSYLHDSDHDHDHDQDQDHHPPYHYHADSSSSTSSPSSPLPTRQLLILALISLAEQTALNSIAPYLPLMARTTSSTTSSPLIGLYVGIIASSFASAQFLTNFFWGALSDRIGRKPVILLGTLLTAICFVLFGLARRLWQVIAVQAVMGAVNGNAGIVPTCLGEITDRSNQSRAFTWLPVIYGLGAIVGPVLGGALVPACPEGQERPYLLVNVVVAALLVVEFVVAAVWLDESLESADAIDLGRVWGRVRSWFVRVWEFSCAARPHYLRVSQRDDPAAAAAENNNSPGPRPRRRRSSRLQGHWTDSIEGALDTGSDGDDGSSIRTPLFSSHDHDGDCERGEDTIFQHHGVGVNGVRKLDLVLIFTTYGLFQLSHVSFNALYPIFSQAPAPLGRDLTPNEIGMSLGFAGVATIGFQIGAFGLVRGMLGNRRMYQVSLGLLVLAFGLMPFVGYKDGGNGDGGGGDRGDGGEERGLFGRPWIALAVELCLILLLKTVATVGGLTSSLLLITNSAPTHSVLGSLNGLAQTLSAAGRGVGPIFSGGLFSLANKMHRGEFLAFGVFGAIAFVGFLLSLGIRGEGLEDGKGRGRGAGRGEEEEEGEGDEGDEHREGV